MEVTSLRDLGQEMVTVFGERIVVSVAELPAHSVDIVVGVQQSLVEQAGFPLGSVEVALTEVDLEEDLSLQSQSSAVLHSDQIVFCYEHFA